MPEMNGYELTRNIRELETTSGSKRMPIIACTANALRGDAETCIAAGMDDYLAKPIELKTLAKKLDYWLPIAETFEAVDRSVLAAVSGGDIAMEREILADFRRTNDDDASKLRRAVERFDTPTVTISTHRMQGASRMIGANGLAGVCALLESASRAGDWSAVTANMGTFDQELERVNTYCQEAA
jgi:CheY-like chemotaxis protein